MDPPPSTCNERTSRAARDCLGASPTFPHNFGARGGAGGRATGGGGGRGSSPFGSGSSLSSNHDSGSLRRSLSASMDASSKYTITVMGIFPSRAMYQNTSSTCAQIALCLLPWWCSEIGVGLVPTFWLFLGMFESLSNTAQPNIQKLLPATQGANFERVLNTV